VLLAVVGSIRLAHHDPPTPAAPRTPTP
jgi:hypothetical protein